MVDSRTEEPNPFNLDWIVLERLNFTKVGLGEIGFENTNFEQIDSRFDLVKFSLEMVLACMEN